MKTIEQIIDSSPIYLGLFDSEASVFDNFEVKPEDQAGIKLLFSVYAPGSYSGSAYVLFSKDGILYEVHGGHCSCYGLEGQFTDCENVVLEELCNRLTIGEFMKEGDWDDWDGANEKLQEFLGMKE